MGRRTYVYKLEWEGLCTCPEPTLIAVRREDEVALVLLLFGLTLEKQQVYLTFVVYLVLSAGCSEPGLG